LDIPADNRVMIATSGRAAISHASDRIEKSRERSDHLCAKTDDVSKRSERRRPPEREGGAAPPPVFMDENPVTPPLRTSDRSQSWMIVTFVAKS